MKSVEQVHANIGPPRLIHSIITRFACGQTLKESAAALCSQYHTGLLWITDSKDSLVTRDGGIFNFCVVIHNKQKWEYGERYDPEKHSCSLSQPAQALCRCALLAITIG